jgi:integrase
MARARAAVSPSRDPFLDEVDRLIEYPVDAKGAPLKKGTKRYLYDPGSPDLCVRVTDTGAASYVIRVHDPLNGKYTYTKLGTYGDTTLEHARAAAANMRSMVKSEASFGRSYVEKKAADKQAKADVKRRTAITLQEALDRYVKRPGLAKDSIDDYKSCVGKHCEEWLPKPVSYITIERFERRFLEIHETNPPTALKAHRYLRAILRHQWKRDKGLFPEGVPIPSVRDLGNIKKPPPKDSRLDARDLPALRAKLLELDDYDRDYLLIMLFTGMRAGAVNTLRYDLTIDQTDKLNWRENRIMVYEATVDRDPVPLIINNTVKSIIQQRRERCGHLSPWLFWSRQNVMAKKAEDRDRPIGDNRQMFERLGLKHNKGDKLTAHDLRRSFSWLGRIACRVDKLVIGKLMLHSMRNLDVMDGYVSLEDRDLRRETNLIAKKIDGWMKSTYTKIDAELNPPDNDADLVYTL